MSSRPPRWARAVICAAAAAIAAVTVAGPFAAPATAHPGGDRGPQNTQLVPDHLRELARQIPADATDFGEYADRIAFLWDMPLPVDEEGWWAGWRNFEPWATMFWPADGGPNSNAVRGPEPLDFSGNTFPSWHPLISHEAVAAAANNETLATQVWAAAEHFCSRGMSNYATTAPGVADHVWTAMRHNADDRRTISEVFYDQWTTISPLHGTFGSVHGRLLTVPLVAGELRGTVAPNLNLARVTDTYEPQIKHDRDGTYDEVAGLGAVLAGKGAAYAADPYGEWLADAQPLSAGFYAARHGRCPQPVIEWWMWLLVWHGKLDPATADVRVGGESLGTVAALRGSPPPPDATDETDETVVWETEGAICPLTWPETIGDGYDPSGEEGVSQIDSNEKISDADRVFWKVAQEDILAFHTVAHLAGCTGSAPLAFNEDGERTGDGDRPGVALDWWLRVMWQTSKGQRPEGTFAVDWSTDLWAGDVGPPFTKYQVRSDTGTNLTEALLLTYGLIASGLANLAARTAGDWAMAAFTLKPLENAADGVIQEVTEWSRNVVAVGGNLWRIMIMGLIAWAAWQMARKRKVAGTFREIGLSVLLFTVLAGTAALGIDTTLRSVVSVMQAAIGGAATVLTPQQGCYAYVPHADLADVKAQVDERVNQGGNPSDPQFWHCDGEDENAGTLDAGWASVKGVLPVVVGTTCLWPAEHAGLVLASGPVPGGAGGAIPDAAVLRLCPLRHLVKETLTIGPVWGNNLGAQQLAHSVVEPIDGHLSGWACAMWADRITFEDYASGPDLFDIEEAELTPLMTEIGEAYGCAHIAEPGSIGVADSDPRNATGIQGHLHFFGAFRLADTYITLFASTVGFIVVLAAFAVTLVGQFGIIVAVGFLPLVAAVAVVPGRPRQWLWRWLRFLTHMLLAIVAPAGVLLLFFHLTNIGTNMAAAVGGPPQLTRMIVVLSTIILTVVVVRTMKKRKTLTTTATTMTEKVQDRTTKLAKRDKDSLAVKVAAGETLPSSTLAGSVTAGTKWLGGKVVGKVTGKPAEGASGTTVAAAAGAAAGKASRKPAGATAGKSARKPAGATADAKSDKKPADPAGAETGAGATVAKSSGKPAGATVAKSDRTPAKTPVDPAGALGAGSDAGADAGAGAGAGARAGAKALGAGVEVVGVDPARSEAPGATVEKPAKRTAKEKAAAKEKRAAARKAVAQAWETGNVPAGQEGAAKRISRTAAAAKRVTKIADAATKPIPKQGEKGEGSRLVGAAKETLGAARTWEGETFKDARQRKPARDMIAEQQQTDEARQVSVGLATAAADETNISAVAAAAVSGSDAVLADGTTVGSEQIRTLMSDHPTVAEAVGERIISEVGAGRRSDALVGAAVDIASNENVDESLRRRVATAASVEDTTAESLWDSVDVEPPKPGQPATGQAATGQPATGQAATGQPATGQPATGQLATGQPATGRPSALPSVTVDQPAVDEPAVDEPAVDEPAVDEPAVDEPAVDEPAADEPPTDEPDGWNAAQLLEGLADPDPGKRAAYVSGASPDAFSDPGVQSALLEEESTVVHRAVDSAAQEHVAQGHPLDVPDEWEKDWTARARAQETATRTSGWDAAVTSPNQQTRARAVRSAPLEALTPLTRRLDDPGTAASVMVRAMPATGDTDKILEVKQALRDMVVATADAGKEAADAPDIEGGDRLARMIDWDEGFVEKYAAEAPHDPDTDAWSRVTATLANRDVTAARKQKIAAAVEKNRTVSDDYQKWVKQAVAAAETDRSGGGAGS